MLLSFSALNLEESQPVQTEPPIDDNNVPENVLCPVCLIVKVNTVFNCTHVSCSSCAKRLNVVQFVETQFKKKELRFFRLN